MPVLPQFLKPAVLQQAVDSAATSLRQVPALFSKDFFVPGTRNMDIGGGKYDLGTDFLAGRGVASQVFDPFNRSQAHNEAVFDSLLRHGPADTATVANVLNVIKERGSRRNVIHQANRAIRPEGSAFFQIYEGVPEYRGVGMRTAKGWQNNLPTSAYMDDILDFFNRADRRGNIIIAAEPKDMGRAAWLLAKDGPVRQYAVPIGAGGTLAAAVLGSRSHLIINLRKIIMQPSCAIARKFSA